MDTSSNLTRIVWVACIVFVVLHPFGFINFIGFVFRAVDALALAYPAFSYRVFSVAGYLVLVLFGVVLPIAAIEASKRLAINTSIPWIAWMLASAIAVYNFMSTPLASHAGVLE